MTKKLTIMVCRLCLTDANKSIHLYSEEKIQKCIAKFLQLELSSEDPISKIICIPCWQQLDNFQKFYLQIEEAQKTLNKINEEVYERCINSNEIKEEDQLENSNGDSSDNDDNILNCMDVDIVKSELQNEQEYKSELEKTNSSESNESIQTRRITRHSTLNKTVFNNLSDIEGKRKTSQGLEVEKYEVKKTDDKDKEEREKNNNDSNGKKKSIRPRKSKKVNLTEKAQKSEKFLNAIQTAKECDEIIQKHMNLSCDICSVQVSDFAELKHHFRLVHKRRGYAVCCNRRLHTRNLLVDHINVHNNPEHFKCTECEKILSDRLGLHKHVIAFHQTEELKTFQCDYCPRKFATQNLLDLHSINHIPKNECTFICSECGNGFPTNTRLKLHLKQVHSTLYDKMCEICAKLIRGKAAFKRHVEEHKGIIDPQLQCTQCGAWFKENRNLRKHIMTQHSNDDTNYPCDVCGKKAKSKASLQGHMRYVHHLSRIFKCKFCDKSFKKEFQLKEHTATHTGQVLYACSYCPATFKAKGNMYVHRKKMHLEEWEANKALSKVRTE